MPEQNLAELFSRHLLNPLASTLHPLVCRAALAVACAAAVSSHDLPSPASSTNAPRWQLEAHADTPLFFLLPEVGRERSRDLLL